MKNSFKTCVLTEYLFRICDQPSMLEKGLNSLRSWKCFENAYVLRRNRRGAKEISPVNVRKRRFFLFGYSRQIPMHTVR